MKDYEHDLDTRELSDTKLAFEAEFDGTRRDSAEEARDLHDPRRYWHMIFGGTD